MFMYHNSAVSEMEKGCLLEWECLFNRGLCKNRGAYWIKGTKLNHCGTSILIVQFLQQEPYPNLALYRYHTTVCQLLMTWDICQNVVIWGNVDFLLFMVRTYIVKPARLAFKSGMERVICNHMCRSETEHQVFDSLGLLLCHTGFNPYLNYGNIFSCPPHQCW